MFINATAERVIDLAGTDPQRWKVVFEHINSFPHTIHGKLLKAATSFSESLVPDFDRKAVSEELAEQISRHRRFEDAAWALPKTILEQLDAIHSKLKPRSVVLQNAWLFAQWPDPFFEDAEKYEDRQKALDKARGDAVNAILDTEGFPGIEILKTTAESPNEVGRALSIATGDGHREAVIPAMLKGDAADRQFANGFIWNRFYPDSWDWADSALESCNCDDSKAWLLAMLPFSPEAWQHSEQAGPTVDKLYWERCRAFNPDLESNDIQHAVARLVENKRLGRAIDVLSKALHNERTLSEESLFSPLEAILKLSADEQREQLGQNSQYNIQRIIESLQNLEGVDINRLIAVEWHFVRLLDDHSGHSPRTLQSHLGNSPEFFVAVVSFAFRSRNDREQDGLPEPTPRDRYMEEQAYRLLSDWKVVPGTDQNGKVDEALLRAWCFEVRRLAKEAGRTETCDHLIGTVFSHAPEDDDGTWPCNVVRRVAEEIGTDDLATGMYCGVMNARGAVFRASVGDQERKLAQQCREKSDRIRFDSPFVARILDSVAASYEREAKSWNVLDRWEAT